MAKSTKGNQYTPYIHAFAPLLAFITWVSGPWRYAVGRSEAYYIISPIVVIMVFVVVYAILLAVACIFYENRKKRYAAKLLKSKKSA
jgi:uncharacterized membrane protein